MNILNSIDDTAAPTRGIQGNKKAEARRAEFEGYLTWHNFVYDDDVQNTSDIPIISLKRILDHLLRHDLKFAETFLEARERFPGQ